MSFIGDNAVKSELLKGQRCVARSIEQLLKPSGEPLFHHLQILYRALFVRVESSARILKIADFSGYLINLFHQEIALVFDRHRYLLKLLIGHYYRVIIAGAAAPDEFLTVIFVEILFRSGEKVRLRI